MRHSALFGAKADLRAAHIEHRAMGTVLGHLAVETAVYGGMAIAVLAMFTSMA